MLTCVWKQLARETCSFFSSFRSPYGLPFVGQNDFMMWLIEDAPPGFEQTPEGIANRGMALNFATIHTSSMVRSPYPFCLPFHRVILCCRRSPTLSYTSLRTLHGWSLFGRR